MSRIALFIFLTLLCVSRLCYSDELTVDSIIHGVNQAWLQIQSGEVQFAVTHVNYAAQKSEAEIAVWIQQERERELKDFSEFIPVTPETPKIGLQEFEEQYLTPFLNFWAKWERQRTEIEEANIAFQILERGEDFPKLYQHKMSIQKLPRLSLDSQEAQHHQAGNFYLLAYDTQRQVRVHLGDIVAPTPPFNSVRLSSSDKFAGFRDFASYGRYNFPTTAKLVGKETVDGAVCHLLAYEIENGPYIKIWVDVEKDFCVRRIESRTTPSAPIFYLATYQRFRRFGEVWYPMRIQITESEKDGTIERVTTVEVKAAEFNVDFPKDFFKIHPESYGSIRDRNALEIGQPSTISKTESENLLLLCGPQTLLRICEILHVKTDFRELKKLSSFDPNRGTTMLGLRDAAKYKGLNSKGVKANLKGLKKKKVPMPAIAYVDGNHFLVFEEIQRNGVHIFDPANKYNSHLSWKTLSEIWEGELLIFDIEKSGKPTPEPVPLAFAPETEHDFGKALGGSEIKHTFAIQNIGQKALKILSVTETCACTAAVVSQHEIPAGANGMIEAVLKVPSENTLVEESISVFTDDPTQNTVTLTLKGQAFIPLKTFPARLAFGNQKHFQSPLTKKLSLHTESKVLILGVRTDSEHLRAKLDDGKIPHVEVQLLPTMPIGQFSHRLLVDYQYEGKETVHDVFIFGEVLGAFRVMPKRFFFGLVKGPKAVSKTTTISSLDDQPFKIMSVESTVKAVTVTVTKSTGENRYRITTTIDPKSASGELSGEVVIKTDNAIQPTLRIPFFGIIGESN